MEQQEQSVQAGQVPSAEIPAAEGKLMIQVHELEVKLFRLKQLEELLDNPRAPVNEQIAAREERKAILATVAKPVGVPISVFRAQSDENAAMVAQLFEDLRTGKIHLS